MKIFDVSKIIVPFRVKTIFKTISKYAVLALLCSVLCTPAYATIGMQELGDSLTAFTGFSRVWSPPVRVKQLRADGRSVTVRTNATLHDMRWTPQNLAALKQQVSRWVLGHPNGKVTIYTGKTDIDELVTDQYSVNGQKFTKIIKNDEQEKLQNEINERVILDKEIKTMLNNGKRNIILSNNAREMTGTVMSGNRVVATFDKGVLVDYDESLLLACIQVSVMIMDLSLTRLFIIWRAIRP